MRSRRPIAINNSLCHGICNYSCRLCGVNKPGYCGPKEFQPRAVTEQLIARVQAAAASGIHVRYIANAGDGEPTLHPEFCERMAMFGSMLRCWNAPVPAPEISVVTNGARLLAPGILETLAENRLTLVVSFPTPEAAAYGGLMTGQPERGAGLLGKVVPGIEAAMSMAAGGGLARLNFHVSPPEREVVRRDFPKTVDFLTGMARSVGLAEIDLVMFPATANRSGLVRNRFAGTDMYRDFFRQYDGQPVNGVTVRMKLVLHRFFAGLGEIADLVRAFSFPCLWNANLFIAAGGESICCNDQAVRNPQGNVLTHSIAGLMAAKERQLPGRTCAGCDQRPERMTGSPLAAIFALAARARLALADMTTDTEETKHDAQIPAVAAAAEANPGPADERQEHVPWARNRLLSPEQPPVPAAASPAGREGARPSRLTRHLRRLEQQDLGGPDFRGSFSFDGGRYTIRTANDLESRRKAYQLVYRLYREKEYARPHPSEMWLNIFDALPETATLLVEKAGTGEAVGALTVVFDSPMGLPADDLYGPELDTLRASGRRLSEIVSLGVAEGPEAGASSRILVKLFNVVYLLSRRIRGATDFMITVNPRHVRFYERTLLFQPAGPERSCAKVGGAPALLLRLDLSVPEERVRLEHGPVEGRPPKSRTLYPMFHAPAEEPEVVAGLGAQLRPMSAGEFDYFFSSATNLLAEAAPAQRRHVLNCHRAHRRLAVESQAALS